MGFFKKIAKATQKSAKTVGSTMKDVGSAVGDAAEDTGEFFEKAAKKSGKAIKTTATSVGTTVVDVAEDTGDFVVGIGEDAADAIARGAQESLEAVKSAGKAVGAFATKPLSTFDLPQGWGKVKIWLGVYEIHLTKDTIEDIESGGNIATAVGVLVGAIVGASGGTLAPVAPVLAGYLALEWTLIVSLANQHGVKLRGTYVPYPPGAAYVIVPTPGDQ